MKPEIRISKSETILNAQNSNDQNTANLATKLYKTVLFYPFFQTLALYYYPSPIKVLSIGKFEFRICFVLRYSDFVFVFIQSLLLHQFLYS